MAAEAEALMQKLLDDGVLTEQQLNAILDKFGRRITDPDEIAYIEFLIEGGKRS